MENNNKDNVLQFPKPYQGPEIPTVEEIDQNVEMMKYYHIQETVAALAPIIFNNLDVAGFYVTDSEETSVKDGAFILESIKSMMCKYYGLYHPFQLISDKVFMQDADDYEMLTIVDSLNVELKKSENE